jgi:hypothetical protein
MIAHRWSMSVSCCEDYALAWPRVHRGGSRKVRPDQQAPYDEAIRKDVPPIGYVAG